MELSEFRERVARGDQFNPISHEHEKEMIEKFNALPGRFVTHSTMESSVHFIRAAFELCCQFNKSHGYMGVNVGIDLSKPATKVWFDWITLDQYDAFYFGHKYQGWFWNRSLVGKFIGSLEDYIEDKGVPTRAIDVVFFPKGMTKEERELIYKPPEYEVKC